MIIDNFRGPYYFLSNFYNCKIEFEGLIYDNAESAFQAMKVADPNDRLAFVGIQPNIAKRRGRMVRLRKDWEEVKDQLMYEIVKVKFTQHEDLKERLLNTNHSTLIEGNTWNDTYWGICNGRGRNKLGEILMRVRNELKNAEI